MSTYMMNCFSKLTYNMAAFVDDLEFGFRIATFHHATEAYKIANRLAENGICAAMWADWWGFKMESLDGIEENLPLVHAAGACAMIHSDDNVGIDVEKGLKRTRVEWVKERGGVEDYEGRPIKPVDNGNVTGKHLARNFPNVPKPMTSLPAGLHYTHKTIILLLAVTLTLFSWLLKM